MIMKNKSKIDLKKAIFGCFFAIIGVFGLLSNVLVNPRDVQAVTNDEITSVGESNEGVSVAVNDDDATRTSSSSSTSSGSSDASDEDEKASGDSCQKSLGAIGWLVCPTTGKIAEAIDGLYSLIEKFLVVNPISTEDGSPVYEIWKYCRGLTNIVFIIFLLVVIYSQLTGFGISNYGVKRALPKLIIAAVLVNLSFLICSLAVDVSNVIGNGLRGLFATIGESALSTGDAVAGASSVMKVSYADMFSSLAAGTALTIGGVVLAFESGAIWMLIPTILGAFVAIVSGLITITLRQAVVVLLIMISPLAMVAYILPNTENLFKKWKDLLIRMLVFYPMFSLLFGASNLAGFAIISSANSVFGILLGMAVQIFPLFFSWSLMKMSGTFLGTVNQKLRGFAAGPLAKNRAWADSKRANTRSKFLASNRPTTPSLRLAQFMFNRRTARDMDTKDNEEFARKRAEAYRRNKRYNKDLSSSKKGIDAYEKQALMMGYDEAIARDDNNMNKGLGGLKVNQNSRFSARLAELDNANVVASDRLKVEKARGDIIEYDNAKGFHNRMEEAINAHEDEKFGYRINSLGQRERNKKYKFHFDDSSKSAEALNRFNMISGIMEGDIGSSHYAAATSAHAYDTQIKMMANKYQKYFEMTPPSKDLKNRVSELTLAPNAADYIDAIIPGLRVINQRGDTDVVKEQMNNMLNGERGIQLGTHASQALASFLMFEVKDSDPWLRRFGKYINLETANVYNKNNRKVMNVTYDEYIRGYHDEPDPNNPGQTKRMYAKKGMATLMEGTPLDNLERTAFASFDESLKQAYKREDGTFDFEGYAKKRGEVQKAIGAQFNSASAKYLAGSEQLKNAVSFLTGYSYVQAKDEKGNLVVSGDEPVYEWKSDWDDGDSENVFKDHKDEARKYFRDKTREYIESMTPTQILGMRSDYRDPVMEHLVDMFNDDSPEEAEEYNNKMSEIQTRYGDLPPNKAKMTREKDIRKLKMEIAGKQMRKILGKTGKLAQIYRTRNSGAANGAKDWLRQWVSLDDESTLLSEVKRYDKRQQERDRRNASESDSEAPTRVYDSATIDDFILNVDNIWNNSNSDDVEDFYEKTLKYVKDNLGEESYIVSEYKRYREDDPYADSNMLKEYLEDLLRDPENY